MRNLAEYPITEVDITRTLEHSRAQAEASQGIGGVNTHCIDLLSEFLKQNSDLLANFLQHIHHY